MVKLIAKPACVPGVPLRIGDVEAVEVIYDQLFSVAPFQMQQSAVSEALKAQIGLGLTPLGRRKTKDNVTVQWFGHGVWLVTAPVSLTGMAAVTDQSDAWAVVKICGTQMIDVLARLVPIDLRPAHFKTGYSARTMAGALHIAITRVDAHNCEIMVMRSMAATLMHELETVMRRVAAR
ncbi:sarcosine oxidase subunit gamma [Yoonia sp. BS5-3]|uniref:Sarcosine oxidase subunit gamma n=1 Tax=Yoonia phaeophyticola TaxID=3137369 RepID=A0ABZ2V3E2_9RHOB